MTIERKYKCPYCKRTYAMLWAYENHIKVCPYKFEEKKGGEKNERKKKK